MLRLATRKQQKQTIDYDTNSNSLDREIKYVQHLSSFRYLPIHALSTIITQIPPYH